MVKRDYHFDHRFDHRRAKMAARRALPSDAISGLRAEGQPTLPAPSREQNGREIRPVGRRNSVGDGGHGFAGREALGLGVDLLGRTLRAVVDHLRREAAC